MYILFSTYTLTYLCTHRWLTYVCTHWLTYVHTDLLMYSLTYLCTHWLTYVLIVDLPIYVLIDLLMYLLTYICTQWLIYVFVDLPLCSLTYLCTSWLNFVLIVVLSMYSLTYLCTIDLPLYSPFVIYIIYCDCRQSTITRTVWQHPRLLKRPTHPVKVLFNLFCCQQISRLVVILFIIHSWLPLISLPTVNFHSFHYVLLITTHFTTYC